MIRVGIAGFGFMGRMHYQCWKDVPGAQVIDVCDVNENIEEDAKKALGNIEGANANVDFDKLQLYTRFEDMLADGEVDAVSITLPTFMHKHCSIQALEAGCHVLCEKPMALNSTDCEDMIQAARSSGKVFQIGHCTRFWPEYAWTKRKKESGEYGKVLAASFRRLSKTPTWSWDNWFMDEKRSGGVVLDLHIHDTDYVHYLFGMPQAVSSRSAKGADGNTCHIVSQYLFDDETLIHSEGGWHMMPSFGFEMSFNIMLERATLVFDCTRDPSFRVCLEKGEAFTPKMEAGDGYSLEIAHFARAVAGEKVADINTPEQSRDTLRIIEAERESAKKGETVRLV